MTCVKHRYVRGLRVSRDMRENARMTTSLDQDLGWVPTLNTFGARLAVVRQRMGWGNLKEAAIACGLPPASWRSWERDGVSPRRVVEIARGISERTGVDYMWLLTGQTPSDPRPDGPAEAVCAIRDSNPEPADWRIFAGQAPRVPLLAAV